VLVGRSRNGFGTAKQKLKVIPLETICQLVLTIDPNQVNVYVPCFQLTPTVFLGFLLSQNITGNYAGNMLRGSTHCHEQEVLSGDDQFSVVLERKSYPNITSIP